MAYEEFVEDLDNEEEKWNADNPPTSFLNNLTRSHLYLFLRSLLIYPDIFFTDLFSRPLKLGIPFVIIALLCILHIPYKIILNPQNIIIANPFGIIGNIIILYGPWNTLFDLNFLSSGNNDPVPHIINIICMIFLILYPFYQVITQTLFFLLILHLYTKTAFARLKPTFIWVTYGMFPLLISGVIFKLKDIITKPFNDVVMLKFLDVSATLHTSDHIDIPNIAYAIFALSISSFIDVVIVIGFLYWSAKIWYAGLSEAESLPTKKTRNIIVFVAGTMICLYIFSFIIGVIWRYNWFFHNL